MIFVKTQTTHSEVVIPKIIEFHGGVVQQVADGLVEFRCDSLINAREALTSLRKD